MKKHRPTFADLLFTKLALPMGSVFTLLIAVIALQFYFNSESAALSTFRAVETEMQQLGDFVSAQLLVDNQDAGIRKVNEFNQNHQFVKVTWRNSETASAGLNWEFPLQMKKSVPLATSGSKLGHLDFHIDLLNQKEIKLLLEFGVCVIVLATLLLVYLFLYATRTFPKVFIAQPLDSIVAVLSGKEDGRDEIDIAEFSVALGEIRRLVDKVQSSAKKESLYQMASQISHDVRSPLSALEMISSTLGEIPEEKRIVVRNAINRIRDIANDLLRQSRIHEQNEPSNFDVSKQNYELSSEILFPLIDEIVSEKRTQFFECNRLAINFEQTVDSYGKFSRLIAKNFKSVISNLLNNAIEALPNHTGTVEVILRDGKKDFNDICIIDSGVGIKPEILSRLGKRGATFNKENGTGYGIANAKLLVEAWGGSIDIRSTLGKGTEVIISLPKCDPPSWFVPVLVIPRRGRIVAFDDDNSMLQLWRHRLKELNLPETSFCAASSLNELTKAFQNSFTNLENSLYLIDYEISGCCETGLQIIERLGIHNQSILVTSHHNEPELRDRCSKLGVPIIPKTMSSIVPINFSRATPVTQLSPPATPCDSETGSTSFLHTSL